MSRPNDPEGGSKVDDNTQNEEARGVEVSNSKLELEFWQPQPIQEPRLNPAVFRLPWPQRSAEIILWWIRKLEHWLSPSGWLRAWIRLNLWLATVLCVAAFTVIPAVTSVMNGLTGWSAQMGMIADDVSRAVHRLPPILVSVGAILLVIHFVRRHRQRHFHRSTRNYENWE